MTATDATFTPVSLHFDDCDWSFPALQNNARPVFNLFITEETYQRLQREGHIDGGAGDAETGPASDFAPIALHPAEYAGLRDISDWDVNFDD